MANPPAVRVILDVNVWISIVLGRKLLSIHNAIESNKIAILTCDILTEEFIDVLQRPKISKYLEPQHLDEAIDFFLISTVNKEINLLHAAFSDPKDNYLIDLCQQHQPQYLVTGDKAILALKQVDTTGVISFTKFRQLL